MRKNFRTLLTGLFGRSARPSFAFLVAAFLTLNGPAAFACIFDGCDRPRPVDPAEEAKSREITRRIDQEYDVKFQRTGGREFQSSALASYLGQQVGRPATAVWIQFNRQRDGSWRNYEKFPAYHTDGGFYCRAVLAAKGDYSGIFPPSYFRCYLNNGKPLRSFSQGR